MISISAERFGELLGAEARLAEVEAERDNLAGNFERLSRVALRRGERLAAVLALCEGERYQLTDTGDQYVRVDHVRAAATGEDVRG